VNAQELELAEATAAIHAHLNLLVKEQEVPYKHLFEAARYAIAEGKRIRPLLTLVTAQIFGVPQEVALTPACAVELVHAYSLIHDDLPCMDDDDFRRGKPTVHKVYEEGHAVLTGDFLLTFAFEVLAEAPSLSIAQRLELIATLAKNAGGNGMIGGQVMDIAIEGKDVDLEMLRYLHKHKTGALIATAIEFGAIIAPPGTVDAAHRQILRQFGENIGLAFQIIDDIIDVTHSEKKHGRAIASDLVNQKTTYVGLLGLEGSQQAAMELWDSSKQLLSLLPYDTSALETLADLIVNRQE
jgi:geranylgeranyl diphosphate synthase type II